MFSAKLIRYDEKMTGHEQKTFGEICDHEKLKA